jgi:hypothetical protein
MRRSTAKMKQKYLQHMRSTMLLNFNASNTMLVAEQSLSLDDVFTRTGGFGKF